MALPLRFNSILGRFSYNEKDERILPRKRKALYSNRGFLLRG